MFFDAVYFFCFLFACGHVGFFVYGGVGVKYRYGLACVYRGEGGNNNIPYGVLSMITKKIFGREWMLLLRRLACQRSHFPAPFNR